MSFDSKKYWNDRYTSGGNSGSGSYNEYVKFKADVINEFIKNNSECKSYLELGCGDGNQQSLINYPNYIGYDISENIIEKVRKKYSSSSRIFTSNVSDLIKSDVVLSLDVIYHLIEDSVYNTYMSMLFKLSNKYVIIYSTNKNGDIHNHYRDREFIKDINKDFSLKKTIINKTKSSCNFYFFKRNDSRL